MGYDSGAATVPADGIEVFGSDEFGTLRTVDKDGMTLFCARDVAIALGYRNPNDAIRKHCRSDGIAFRDTVIDQRGQEQQMRFITEGDVYRLIAHSKLPGAERFERWVFDEVLPAIRRHGGYMVARQEETPEQLMARAIKVAEQTIARMEARNRALEPKAGAWDALMDGERWSTVTEAARLLHQYDKSMNRKRLSDLLMGDGMLTRDRQASKLAVDRGYLANYMPPAYFDQKTGQQVRPKPYGKLTSKGIDWCLNRYCGQGRLMA